MFPEKYIFHYKNKVKPKRDKYSLKVNLIFKVYKGKMTNHDLTEMKKKTKNSIWQKYANDIAIICELLIIFLCREKINKKEIIFE